MIDTGDLRKHLSHKLTQQRYYHSMCVRRQAIRLAALHGVDWYRAEIAGLLHDVCHCDPHGVMLAYMRANGVRMDALLMEHPQIWHSIAGAVYIQKELGISDAQIIRAVRYHTTGRAEMSALEQVIYLADKTSEDRDYPGVAELRAISRQSLEEGMAVAISDTVRRLVLEGKTIVKDAWEAYNDFTMKV